MLKTILSMRVAVAILFIFGAVIGLATFIENDYGTQTARALIYNARWFEVFLFFFILVLIYNIIKYKSYKKKKLSIFIFHFAFLIIAIGAAITRYIGYEGIMHIREGQSSNTMVSDVKVLQIDAIDGGKKAHYEKKVFFSSMNPPYITNPFYKFLYIILPKNDIDKTLDVNGKDINIKLIKYLPAATQEVSPDPNGKMALILKVSNGSKGKDISLFEGESYDAGSFIINFNKDTNSSSNKPTLNIFKDKDGLKIKTDFDMQTLAMDTQQEQNLSKGINSFQKRKLYRFGPNMVVLRDVYDKASIKYVSHSLKTKSGVPEMARFKITVGDKSKTVDLFAYSATEGEPKMVKIGDTIVNISLGAKVIRLPFSLKLIDFQLERYPGSMSPSSYASEVELTDEEMGIKNMPFRIYMNHVLDHRNYRFFQSSFDMDEKGTILSVNHDPGTIPTYIGYILLMVGMLWNLFAKGSRFQKLLARAKKLQNTTAILAIALFIGFGGNSYAAPLPELDTNSSKIVHGFDAKTVDKFAHLSVQDTRGRMKPIDTLSHEIVSKLTGKTSIYGVEPTAIFLGMTTNPHIYQNIPMIKISHTRVAKDLGLPKGTKYASFSDFFTRDGNYKLAEQISISTRKKPLDKNQYDNELIKIDERLNIAYMVYMGSLLQIYPVPNDANNKWVNPQEAIEKFPKELSVIIRQMTQFLFQGVENGLKSGDWSDTNRAIGMIDLYQKKFGSKVMPSAKHVDIEIEYNRLGLLSKLVLVYLMVGILLLIFSFINVVRPSFSLKWIMRVAWGVTIVAFILQLLAMGMRWYIAGHAPWSNAYESIVFIAGATIMAGLFFAKNSPFTLAATTLLGGITLGVAHMSFVNPEITNLVPVLKSYWLMIHVATIISGDGFLGLGSILSLLVLVLFIIRGKDGHANIDKSIKELTSIAEMSLIVGLFLLTIGNFLGGVWANESWGRYWGWDAKETWAAVSILVYATVVHLRFIPKLNNPYVFNVASLWAYSSVLMTYFGVNYYLSGLHSYAAGEPVPIPNWVYYGIAGLTILTLLSYRNRKLKKS
ncbi:MAG: cytochrome c biogenesis protein CcsA [Epsilonproteobacteria bacterium]|nr:cytochrome c biogenesis protein CcsA [Campylobacterota bacterium]